MHIPECNQINLRSVEYDIIIVGWAKASAMEGLFYEHDGSILRLDYWMQNR